MKLHGNRGSIAIRKARLKGVLLSLRVFFIAAYAAIAGAAQAQDVSAFYVGKTIRLVVGVGVGSGYDVNARLLARYMAKHIPGNPSFVVQNQPGAASATMTNQLYAVGPFDGTVIGAGFAGMPTIPLLQPGGQNQGADHRRPRAGLHPGRSSTCCKRPFRIQI
jgi:hypothetical protein